MPLVAYPDDFQLDKQAVVSNLTRLFEKTQYEYVWLMGTGEAGNQEGWRER